MDSVGVTGAGVDMRAPQGMRKGATGGRGNREGSGGFAARVPLELVPGLGHVEGAVHGTAVLVQPGAVEVLAALPGADALNAHACHLGRLRPRQEHVRTRDYDQGQTSRKARKKPPATREAQKAYVYCC